MKPFLKETAEEIYRLYGERLEHLCLVFPNRRAGLFFNRYLAECLETPVWSPVTYTIQDLMASLSELDYGDDLELITTLYREYSALKKSPETFDEFFYWGEIMIGDFDDADKYLLDSGDLFRNLSEFKELESSLDYLSMAQVKVIQQFWDNFTTGRLSEQKGQFIDIWNLLLPLYTRFRASLRKQGIAYEGMVYRDVAEKVRSGHDLKLASPTIVFIGFNALNRCEEILALHLQKKGEALFFWDYDTYYTNNERHEAGTFIRENLKNFPDSGEGITHENLAGHPPELHVCSVPSASGQSQVIARILEEAGVDHTAGKETAVVLADEQLLMPVLQALPDGLREINVTMGYPVTATPVFSLIEHLIMLQKRPKRKQDAKFYHEDVIKIIQHQYILLRKPDDARTLIREIHTRNRIYIPMEELAVNDLFTAIFQDIERPGEISSYLLRILEMITAGDKETPDGMPTLELEFIYRIYTRIKRLKDLLGRLEQEFGLAVFLRIFHKHLQRTRIPFTGEPLAGLQVMGVLETRVLDFERVIILSMNEGAFPETTATQSFIPQNLRRGFGLPTMEHQSAIYAYYFYRLIQRAGHVSMIYNSKTEGLNTGEKSRYIFQLQYDPVFTLKGTSAGFDIQTMVPGPIQVEKNPGIMDILAGYHAGGDHNRYLSPSALNAYMKCPLRFYFRYVAFLEKPAELLEEVDPAMFGTLLHEIMKMIYGSLQWPVEAKEITRILDQYGAVDLAVEETFQRILYGDNTGTAESGGRNMIIQKILASYARKILEIDRESCPLQFHSLEKKYMTSIEISSQGPRIRIGGKIDRIDRVNGIFRVLDYKTGRGSLLFRSIEELFDGNYRNRNEAAFQTLLYAKIFSDSPESGKHPVKPGLFLIRDMFTGSYRPDFAIGTLSRNIPLDDYTPLDHDFTQYLSQMLCGLFDPGLPFLQTSREEHCMHCEYRVICHR